MMCFGVMFVWEVRDGRRLEIIYVGFDKLFWGVEGRLLYNSRALFTEMQLDS
jgi:hypothetical protein